APAAAPARPARRPADRQHSPGTPAAPATVGGVQYRPRIEAEPSILGLSRHTRGRFGARAFNLFFIGVFALILIQLIVALLNP
ncbi:hypothetical protein, partial [Pseudonocardia acidicola]|uniref:hypothetical protein n=1 Tax=Pseudonocardia acidicola TaxID=2724939 RepID=UPI001B7D21F4